MSLYVEGLLVPSVAFSAVPHSSLSAAFHARLPSRSNHPHFVFTTVAGPYCSLSTVLSCNISSNGNTDVVLGLDWASMIRESLTRDGHRLDHSFDPWVIFTSEVERLSGPSLPGSSAPQSSFTAYTQTPMGWASPPGPAPYPRQPPVEWTTGLGPAFAYPQSSGAASSYPSYGGSVQTDFSASQYTVNPDKDFENNYESSFKTVSHLGFVPYMHAAAGPVAGPSKLLDAPSASDSEPYFFDPRSRPKAQSRQTVLDESGSDVLNRLFLSSDVRENLFLATYADLSRLAGYHHIQLPPASTILDLQDFDINLLKRPDKFVDVNAEEQNDDDDDTVSLHSSDENDEDSAKSSRYHPKGEAPMHSSHTSSLEPMPWMKMQFQVNYPISVVKNQIRP
ncbi:hypothetical protein C8F04DRAFT_1294746 [Mycena alexandri]|uniref:Uncharacterized protein n=1 Tax=Mycena alexandri TaxID=1745969 RepID=A0AAD6SHF3_9AGAR|nr:hypothetical protein C8F04DRAFT_1294746 [Mycena alexandri]